MATATGPAVLRAAPKPVPSEVAEALARAAADQFKSGQYVASAEIFMQAFSKSPRPALVFNAARAYEEAGRLGDAAGLFRLYVNISNDPAGVADARARLVRLESKAATGVGASDLARTPSATATEVSASVPAPTDRSRWPAWACAGTGASSIAAGVALLFVGSAGTRDANADPRSSASYAERYDRANSQWWAGAGLAGIGAGLAATALWLAFQRGDDPGGTGR